jgi:UDP-N-acetylglucosamine--N-acetylmuramyl-(pentapeptide) pyrophosphoryl-undecaprenol N-acetylglucosamine transferase
VLARFVRRIFVSFDYSRQFFPPHKAVLTGLPIRSQFAASAAAERPEPFCIFVCGGSQGARQINQAVAAMLPALSGCTHRLRFIHQSGDADHAMLLDAYRRCGLQARVSAFIEDMASCYQAAHMVISRAGAATLAELALCGRAAVLVPYPYAANNHQEINARVFADAGAAMMLSARELQPAALAALVMELEGNRQRLSAMEKRARALARPEAARMIVDECCRLAKPRPGTTAAASQSALQAGAREDRSTRNNRPDNQMPVRRQRALYV